VPRTVCGEALRALLLSHPTTAVIGDGLWPPPYPARGAVRLDGATVTAQVRLGEFALERDEYLPHTYEQLTAAYQRVGDDAATRIVQLAMYRRPRPGP